MTSQTRRGSVPFVERRSNRVDRRRCARGGRRAGDALRTTLFAWLATLMLTPLAAAEGIGFGVDAKSASRARELGMPVAYGSVWAGPWNQKYGWRAVTEQLQDAKKSGVTPIVHWWYWGDDISVACVEQGCTDRYHGVRKDRATWHRLSGELADLIVDVMGPGSRALVVVETEFNKNGIERHEPFDGYLVEDMRLFRQRGLRTVLTFGNWGRTSWTTFDRAAAEADLLGAMALQSSLKDAETYLSGAEMLVSAAKYNRAAFGKGTFITDVGFSSYPERSYEQHQDTVIRDIVRRLPELRAAGVEGLVWRMLEDDPGFDTANYHGVAERHWGLLRADGSPKPGFQPLLNGMLDEQRRAAAATPAAEATIAGR